MSKQDYFSARRVTAWPEPKGGRPGYGVDMWDGNQIWVPEDIFKAEYQPVDGFGFSPALAALKAGKRVTRAGWGGQFLFLAPATKFKAAYLAVELPNGQQGAWLPQKTDILSDDWTVMPDPVAVIPTPAAEETADGNASN